MDEFKKLGLNEKILSAIEVLGFTEPTEIQRAAIPLVLKGADVVGNAATGSGKTLAFASGIIDRCVPHEGVQSLVLAPTRELAEQITKVMRDFAKHSKLRIKDVYGGVSFERQVDEIRSAEVIVGTPGRILDHLEKRTLNLSKLKILVLDESDRMVDMGFLPDVENILGQCPRDRQTLLFSATWSQSIKYIEKHYMKSPEKVAVETYVDPSHLQQSYYSIEPKMKFSLLVHLLKEEKSGITMIFCNTRRNVDLVAKNLHRYGIRSQAIHGGLEQNKRSRIIESLHNKEANILICTDVAARGLDIKDVTYVYNYDIPKTSEEYVHRIGRTARAGKKGMAVNLVTSYDYDNFNRVLMDDSLKVEEKETPEFEILHPQFRREDSGRGFGGREGGFRRGSGRQSFGGRDGRSFGGRGGGYSRSGSSGGSRSGGYSRGGSSRSGSYSRDR